MRLVLQVDGDDGIVVLVVFAEPFQRFEPLIRGVIVIIPKRIVVTGGIGGRAVDIHHDLDAFLAAPLYNLIPDVEAVLRGTALDTLDGQLRVGVLIELDDRIRLAVFPLENDLCGHRHTQQIEAVIGDQLQAVMNIGRPCAVEDLGADIVAEPVDTGHPDLIALHVHDLAVFDMQPVVMMIVGGSSCHCRDSRCHVEQHRAGQCSACDPSKYTFPHVRTLLFCGITALLMVIFYHNISEKSIFILK